MTRMIVAITAFAAIVAVAVTTVYAPDGARLSASRVPVTLNVAQ